MFRERIQTRFFRRFGFWGWVAYLGWRHRDDIRYFYQERKNRRKLKKAA